MIYMIEIVLPGRYGSDYPKSSIAPKGSIHECLVPDVTYEWQRIGSNFKNKTAPYTFLYTSCRTSEKFSFFFSVKLIECILEYLDYQFISSMYQEAVSHVPHMVLIRTILVFPVNVSIMLHDLSSPWGDKPDNFEETKA